VPPTNEAQLVDLGLDLVGGLVGMTVGVGVSVAVGDGRGVGVAVGVGVETKLSDWSKSITKPIKTSIATLYRMSFDRVW
jgi:uncharacterized alkaline shock family protein YloU